MSNLSHSRSKGKTGAPMRLLAKVARGAYLAPSGTMSAYHGADDSLSEEDQGGLEWPAASGGAGAGPAVSDPGMPDRVRFAEGPGTVARREPDGPAQTLPGRSQRELDVARRPQPPAQENVVGRDGSATPEILTRESVTVPEGDSRNYKGRTAVAETHFEDAMAPERKRTEAPDDLVAAADDSRHGAGNGIVHHFSAGEFQSGPQRESRAALKPLFAAAGTAGMPHGEAGTGRSGEFRNKHAPEPVAETKPAAGKTSRGDHAESPGRLQGRGRTPEAEAAAPLARESAPVRNMDLEVGDRRPKEEASDAQRALPGTPVAPRAPETPVQKAVPLAPLKSSDLRAPHAGEAPAKAEAPRRQSGGVKIGRVNINIRGKERPQAEPWPEAPQYADHMITDDWEWSCRYGR